MAWQKHSWLFLLLLIPPSTSSIEKKVTWRQTRPTQPTFRRWSGWSETDAEKEKRNRIEIGFGFSIRVGGGSDGGGDCLRIPHLFSAKTNKHRLSHSWAISAKRDAFVASNEKQYCVTRCDAKRRLGCVTQAVQCDRNHKTAVANTKQLPQKHKDCYRWRWQQRRRRR